MNLFQAAARKAIASVVFSRIVMAAPGMCEFLLFIILIIVTTIFCEGFD